MARIWFNNAEEYVTYRTCLGKRRHPSRSAAKRAVKRMVALRGGKKRLFDAYRCTRCGGYHVGHHNRPDGATQVAG